MSYSDEIIKALERRGTFTVHDPLGNEFAVSFNDSQTRSAFVYIPEENLEKVNSNLNYLISKMHEPYTVDKLLHNAAKEGYLKFKPYITTNDSGTPTLVLQYNRFMHLFRGSHYQVSYTANGIYEYSSSSVHLDSITKKFRYDNDCLLHQSLYYMSMIAAGYGLDSFQDLLDNDSSLLDEFMRLSTAGVFSNYTLIYTELQKLTRVHTRVFDMVPEYVLRIPASDSLTTDYGRVNIYKDLPYCGRLVGVRFCTDNTQQELLYCLPDFGSAGNIAKFQHYYDYEHDEAREAISELYSDYDVFTSLVVYALNTSGFITNNMVTYSLSRSIEKIRALNDGSIKPFDNLSVINALDFIKN